jgi:hypothetical protein
VADGTGILTDPPEEAVVTLGTGAETVATGVVTVTAGVVTAGVVTAGVVTVGVVTGAATGRGGTVTVTAGTDTAGTVTAGTDTPGTVTVGTVTVTPLARAFASPVATKKPDTATQTNMIVALHFTKFISPSANLLHQQGIASTSTCLAKPTSSDFGTTATRRCLSAEPTGPAD